MSYASFFEQLTRFTPFSYQARLAAGEWPELIEIPTGLGKTDAVLVAWLYRILNGDSFTGRRLVYCLPMRALVHQTAEVAQRLCSRAAQPFLERGLPAPTVHEMLGGYIDERWEMDPECPAVLVGTQDLLLSRALNRGYAMSRFKWPIQFGLLHSDCLWVLDETQLMGVAVETSAQLEGLRQALGTFGQAHTIWMSATLGQRQLATIDHPRPEPGGFRKLALGEDDQLAPIVRKRVQAEKALVASASKLEKENRDVYVDQLAAHAADSHRTRGALTLVIVNRVDRAQAVYAALRARDVGPLGLIHSRFRAHDRTRHQDLLHSEGDRVVVATQAVEAGIDISSRTLITELAPWSSLVQRFGRCNRYGEEADAKVFWVDIDLEVPDLALPYEAQDLSEARSLLSGLADAGPESVAGVSYTPRPITRPILRRRDLIDLFDTTPDLLGNDVDVSRFIRDGDDTDVHVYFRDFQDEPGLDTSAPGREEIVRVSIGAASAFLERMNKRRRSLGDGERDRQRKRWLRGWIPSPLASLPWTATTRIHPGQVLLLSTGSGGYDAELGWTGEVLPEDPVPVVAVDSAPTMAEIMDSDPRTATERWVELPRHLSDVASEARELSGNLGLPERLTAAVVTAARWHDLGKAHEEFQKRLVEPVRDDPDLRAPGEGPWAKSSHRRRFPDAQRPYFRHELASALAWMQVGEEGPQRDLVAYLIAAHHGKVRLSIRSVPGERRPDDAERLFARGVWSGDELPPVDLGDGTRVGPVVLDLAPMQLGEGSWLERTLALRDDPDMGPLRLAYLEAVVRIADWRASEKERRGE